MFGEIRRSDRPRAPVTTRLLIETGFGQSRARDLWNERIHTSLLVFQEQGSSLVLPAADIAHALLRTKDPTPGQVQRLNPVAVRARYARKRWCFGGNVVVVGRARESYIWGRRYMRAAA